MSLLDNLRQKVDNRSPIGSPSGVRNSDQSAIVIEHAERVFNDGSVITGARGRDEHGQPVAIPAGLTPAQVGADRILAIPKAATLPEIPPQTQRFSAVAAATSGIVLDRDAGFPIRGMQFDNYTAQWYFIEAAQRYIPPYTFGIQFPVFLAPNKVKVSAEAPPGFTQPALVTGSIFEITCIEKELEYSPGIALQSQGGAPSSSTPVFQQLAPTVGTESNVASSAASVTILASNANRKGALIYNDSTQILFLLLSATGPASSSNYTVQLASQQFFEVPFPVYTGTILGIWAAANGNARVTELT